MSVKCIVALLALAVAALLAAWTTEYSMVRIAAGWTAFAFALLVLAYLGLGPRFLLKHPGGRRRAGAWLLYGPYFLLSSLSLWLFRHFERHPPFVEIVPGLFLGRQLTANEARGDATPRWCAVLDLTAEFAETAPLRGSDAYRSLPVLDTMAPTPDELSAAVTWLANRLAEGPAYVHCALGHGRSATVVVAYLLAIGRIATVEEGLELVCSKRPGVRLNAQQIRALRRYSDALSGERA